MDTFISVLSAITAMVFIALAGVVMTSNQISRARGAAKWLSLSFAVIAIFSILGLVIPAQRFESQPWFDWVFKLEVALLALFPYSLYRFASFFRRQSALLEKLFLLTTTGVIIATFLLPYFPNTGVKVLPIWFIAYIWLFVGHWAVVSLSAAWMLWKNGERRPGVVRSRMNLLAAAALTMTVALLLGGLSVPAYLHINLQIGYQLLTLLSGSLFFFGYRPPGFLKVLWRRKDQEQLREAISGLMVADNNTKVVESLVPPVMRVVGGNSAVLIDDQGKVFHNYQADPKKAEQIGAYLKDTRNTLPPTGELENGTAIYHRHTDGWLVIFVGRATPFLGDEEFQLINSVLTLTDLAFARVAVFEKEKEAVERLEKLDELKTEFVAMVAHDLRSPMAVIAGFADVLRQQRHTLSDAQQDQFLEMISDTIRRLALLVEDILQVARIESGEFKYQLQNFNLCELVRQQAFEQETTNAGRLIEVRAAPIPNVYADPHRITQVINNLITNALKFSPPESRVIIEVSSKGGFCYLTVEDQGMGIAEEDLPRLFNKFSRISPPDGAAKTAGTGLGLFISKSMIEAQSGQVFVESAPGKGSKFGFKIPLAKSANKANGQVAAKK